MTEHPVFESIDLAIQAKQIWFHNRPIALVANKQKQVHKFAPTASYQPLRILA